MSVSLQQRDMPPQFLRGLLSGLPAEEVLAENMPILLRQIERFPIFFDPIRGSEMAGPGFKLGAGGLLAGWSQAGKVEILLVRGGAHDFGPSSSGCANSGVARGCSCDLLGGGRVDLCVGLDHLLKVELLPGAVMSMGTSVIG